MTILSGFLKVSFPVVLALLASACFGDTADPAVTGPDAPERAPEAVDSIPSALVAVGTVKTVDAADYFTDGGELSYMAVSSAPALAAVSVEDRTVTVVGMAKGSATVTVTATGGGGEARQAFTVAVVSLQGPWAREGEVLAWDSISALKGAGAPEGDGFARYDEWREGRAVLNLAHRGGGEGVVVSGGLGVHLTLCDPCGGADTGSDSGRPEIADTVTITVTIRGAASKYVGLAGEQGFGVAPELLAKGQLLHNDLECESDYVLALTDVGRLHVRGENVCESDYYRYRSGIEVTLSPSHTEVWTGLYPVRGRYRAGGAVGAEYMRISHDPLSHGRLVAHLPGCGTNGGGVVESVPGGEHVKLLARGNPSPMSVPIGGGQLVFGSEDRSLTVDPPAFLGCESGVVDIWTDGAAVVGGPRAEGGHWIDPERNPWPGPEGDRAALNVLYDAMGGPNWERDYNWLTDAPLNEWYGVTADDNGRVRGLELSLNRLDGIIPPEIGNLGALGWLDLAANDLSGPIPPEIGNLASLGLLNLSGNNLSGSIPPEIGNLPALYFLSLSGNNLSGPIPLEIGNLAALEYLNLAANDLSGPIPPEMLNLAVRSLSLYNNAALCTPDDAPQLLLEWLATLGPNAQLPSCAALAAVSADQRAALEALYHAAGGSNWKRSDNWMTDAPVSRWSGVRTDWEGWVKELNLVVNDLSGHIPPEIGNLGALQWLNFRGNNLSGPIPPEIGNLGALIRLNLYDNNLSGPIPPEIGNLTALSNLHLQDNALNGPIPPEMANLTTLFSLNLERNALRGPIPPAMVNLLALKFLHLSGNPGLCTPDDSGLLAWFAALNVRPPPRCAGGG